MRATIVPARGLTAPDVSGVMVPKPPLYKLGIGGPVLNVVGSGREVVEVNRGGQAERKRVLHPVEDIRELRANLQNVTFFDAEVAAEVGVLPTGSGSPGRSESSFHLPQTVTRRGRS